jgi:membrane associated rhomboid family serine protease
MIPITDDNSDRTTVPIVNYLLILANILVFIFYQKLGMDNSFTYSYSTIPGEILTGHDIVTQPTVLIDDLTGQQVVVPGLGVTPIPVYFTLITSMFMHGGLGHLGGNMLYLYIFGDNIENSIGHFRYLVFYLLCGVIASICHVLSVHYLAGNDLLPSLGASGAISGVLGAYLLLFPTRRVGIFFFFTILYIPAFLVLGLWIATQVISGVGTVTSGQDGIAYAAHIGGFAAGMLMIKKFMAGRVVATGNTRRWY